MHSISRHSSQASGSEVSSLLFADIVVLLVSSSYNLQRALREVCCQAEGNWDDGHRCELEKGGVPTSGWEV